MHCATGWAFDAVALHADHAIMFSTRGPTVKMRGQSVPDTPLALGQETVQARETADT